MISLFAPDGIGEVTAGTELATVIAAAVAAHPEGPLRDGDILVVTSKVVSKAEGRSHVAADRDELIAAQTVRTVARRGLTAVVETRHGLTLAAAGVDNSNVTVGTVLTLPEDPDRSAADLRRRWRADPGVRVGVVISDTAGRAWRTGQTDLAIGASGVRVIERYAGRRDSYGNELQVTEVALADELAAAADLAKAKLARRPAAVIRGLPELVTDDDEPAHVLVRDPALDMFRFGSREAVLAAVLAALRRPDLYEAAAATADADELWALLATAGLLDDRRPPPAWELLRAVLAAADRPRHVP